MQTTMQQTRPNEADYAPFYAGYVAAVEAEDIVQFLEAQKEAALGFFRSIPWEKWEISYAEGKWTPAEVVQHLIDSERIFAYRAMCIARGDTTPLPSFDQNRVVLK